VATIAASAAALAAVGQLVVLTVAAFYARRQVDAARGQLYEARRLRLDTQRPFVVIDLVRTLPQFMDISIKNVGPLPATDVKFRFDPEIRSTSYEGAGLEQRGIPVLAEQPIFRDGIPTLPPGREISLHFDHIPTRHERLDMPDRYTVYLSYQGPVEEYRDEKSVLDLSIHRATMQLAEKDLHDIHKVLEDLLDVLRKWAAR
jgi:hypothetical protein